MQATERSQGSVYMVFGVLFTIIALVALVSIVFVKSRAADETSQTTSVTNAAPVVSTPAFALTSGGSHVGTSPGFSPTEGTTRNAYIWGTVTDGNGCTNFTASPNTSVKVYRTDVSGGSSCSADNRDCYETTITSFTGCTGAGDNDATYEVTVPVQFYADATDNGAETAAREATDWTVYVSVTDDDGSPLTGTNNNTFEVNSTIALDVTSAVDYGTLALGSISSQQTVTYTNTGNRREDVNLRALADMTCTGAGSSNIPATAVEISTTNGFSYGAGMDITTSAQPLVLNLAQRTQASASTAPAYLRLQIPSTNIRGTCSNTLDNVASSTART